VNLVLLTWNFPPAVGGMEAMMDHLFRGLRQRGHSVRAVTTRGNDDPMEDVHRAPAWRAGISSVFLLPRLDALPETAAGFHSLRKRPQRPGFGQRRPAPGPAAATDGSLENFFL